MVDWIETIPFTETRNYVQRVMESVEIYRRRLGGDDGAGLEQRPQALGAAQRQRMTDDDQDIPVFSGISACVFDAYGTLFDLGNFADRFPTDAGRPGRTADGAVAAQAARIQLGCAR